MNELDIYIPHLADTMHDSILTKLESRKKSGLNFFSD